MDAALINLVRTSLVSASTEHDYTGGELFQRHDEIRLVDPTGNPCAVPLEPSEDNIDYEYSYVTGDRGRALRGTLLDLGLSIDYIENAVARRLEQWKRERAGVLVSPNMGRNTLFSWRAVDMKGTLFNGGPSARDLTENFTLTATYGQHLRYWDETRRMFLPKTTSNRTALAATPGGAGLVSYPSVVNRMVPTYPKSATMSSASTASGWTIGGGDAADVTAAHVSGGFGQADCPDSLRVSVAAHASIDRYLIITDQFNSGHGNYAGYTFANSLSAMACTWIKGRLPAGANLQFGVVGGSDYTVRSVGGLRFDGWTPVMIGHYSDAWAAGAAFYALQLHDSDGMACEFEIGPTMVVQQAGYSRMPAAPVWSPQVTGGTVSGTSRVATGASLRTPGQGTLICSFWAPADIADAWRGGPAHMELCGNSDLRVRYSTAAAGGDTLTIAGVSPANSVAYTVAARGAFGFAGKVNTVAVSWGPAGVKLYVNGALVTTDTTALPAISGSNSAWQVGGNSSSGYSCAPLAMLTCRIDEGAMTDSEVLQVHYALTDPIALGLAIAARGRTFRITRTPGSLRPGAGGSQVLGRLDLEQTSYNPFLADLFAKEASVG